MNQLTKMFEVVNKDGKPDFVLINGQNFNRYDLLALAADSDTKEIARNILKLASHLFHWQEDDTFNTLYGSVSIEIANDFKNDEFSIHHRFNSRVKDLIGEQAKIVKRVNDIHHQPDSWVLHNGNYIPVEMKKEKFNQKALDQLQRYMDFYDSYFGIAVGSELTVGLPYNIKFISTKKLR